MKNFFLISLLTAVVFSGSVSCKKNNPAPTDSAATPVPLSFNFLKAERTGIRVGESTTITAEATGQNISYNWQASTGTIVGQGAQVSYGSTCNSCIGDNTISCTVSDGKSTQTKSIVVSIK